MNVDRLPFHFRNEYLLKNNAEKPVNKILFQSGDKEVLIDLKNDGRKETFVRNDFR